MSEAAQASVPAVETPATPSETPSSEGFSVPEEYSDRGWAKTIKSEDDLYKAFDNSQSLLGKRPAGIPEKDASQEDWDKFYASLGRPEESDKYELSDVEGLPEGIDVQSYQTRFKDFAFAMGLSPEKAQEGWELFINGEKESIERHTADSAEQEEALDKEFDELGNKLFGDQFDDASKKAQAYLKEILPEELGDIPKDLAGNPKALMAMIKIAHDSQGKIDEVKKEYGAEDKLSTGEQSAAVSVHEINAKLADAKARFTKSPVFSPERKTIQDEIDGLRAQLKKAV